jgi:hypothetical protein
MLFSIFTLSVAAVQFQLHYKSILSTSAPSRVILGLAGNLLVALALAFVTSILTV